MYIQVSHVYRTDLQRTCQQYLSLCCLPICFLFLPAFMFVMVWNLSAVEWRFKSAQSFSKQVLVNDWQASKPVGQWTRQSRWNICCCVHACHCSLLTQSVFFWNLSILEWKKEPACCFLDQCILDASLIVIIQTCQSVNLTNKICNIFAICACMPSCFLSAWSGLQPHSKGL